MRRKKKTCFEIWLDSQPDGDYGALARVARKAGITYATAHRAKKGGGLQMNTVKKLVKATGMKAVKFIEPWDNERR